MNGYMSDKLTFTNALHPSPKYPRKLESFSITNTNAHYFMDDLFNMLVLNTHMDKIQIRIIESQYNNNEDWNVKQPSNLYYSYHHKDSKNQRFLLSHIKDKTRIDYRDFYGARDKHNKLKTSLFNGN